MHRDPLQNVAGTSSTAFYWKWNSVTHKVEPWTNLSEWLPVGSKVDLRSDRPEKNSTGHVVLTSYWWDTVPTPRRPGSQLWWSCGPLLRPPFPHSCWFGSWRQKSDGSRRSWYRPSRWCNRSAHLARSSHASDCSPPVAVCSCCSYAAGFQPMRLTLRDHQLHKY